MSETKYSFVYALLVISSLSVIRTHNLNDWVVVVTVSDWYDDIFQNWLFWYKLLDLDLMTIVIAEDTKTYEKYKNNTGLKTIYFGMEEVSLIYLKSKF